MDKLISVFSEAMLSPQFQKTAREQELIPSKPVGGIDYQKLLESQLNLYGTYVKEIGLQRKE